MTRSISILLGSGFSAPIGYPTGNRLNELILSDNGANYTFAPNGQMAISTDGQKPDFGYITSWEAAARFGREVIKDYYNRNGTFDYEEFYDYIKGPAENDPSVVEIASKYEWAYPDAGQLLFTFDNIFQQVTTSFLKDGEGNKYYDNATHVTGHIFPGYTGILNCLKKMGESYIVNVHTLNHDLFFERLNMTDWINGEISDGFEELGSPYYGDLHVKGGTYKCRLEQYKGIYEKKFHLFKLHGSLNYGVYHNSITGSFLPENYIKTRHGVGFGDLYKEYVDSDGTVKYDHCWINYHADFLTGTTSKILRYGEDLLYKTLFNHFKNNLNSAEMLLVIGYGAKDAEVNKIILNNFSFKNKPVFFIDPYAGIAVKELVKQLNATLLDKNLDNVSVKDFVGFFDER